MNKKKNVNKGNQSPAKESGSKLPYDKFYLFPPWRMDIPYPWQIWAIGWLAIFKGFIWLSTSPNVADPRMLSLLAFKFLICTVPFVVLGIAVWNFKKWGVWGMIGLCIADLLFFVLLHPQASRYVAGEHFWLLSVLLLLCDGPLGDMLILIGAPVMLKYAGKTYETVLE